MVFMIKSIISQKNKIPFSSKTIKKETDIKKNNARLEKWRFFLPKMDMFLSKKLSSKLCSYLFF